MNISRVLNHDAEACCPQVLSLPLRISWNQFHPHQKVTLQTRVTPSIIMFLESFNRCDLDLANLSIYHVAAEFLLLWRCWNFYSASGVCCFEVLVIRALNYAFPSHALAISCPNRRSYWATAIVAWPSFLLTPTPTIVPS